MSHIICSAIAALTFSALASFASEQTNARPYPLAVCPVSGDSLGAMGATEIRHFAEREIRFCCADCVDSFAKDLDASFARMDSLIAAVLPADYPLTTCPVSGDVLGEMGAPVDSVYDNRLIRLCCTSCIETFGENPQKYLAKLDAAYAKKSAAAQDSTTSHAQRPAQHDHSQHQHAH